MSQPFTYEPSLRVYSDEEIAYAKHVLETGEIQPDGSLFYYTLPNFRVEAPPAMVARYRAIVAQGKEPFSQ